MAIYSTAFSIYKILLFLTQFNIRFSSRAEILSSTLFILANHRKIIELIDFMFFFVFSLSYKLECSKNDECDLKYFSSVILGYFFSDENVRKLLSYKFMGNLWVNNIT